jgi:hypothetical protein
MNISLLLWPIKLKKGRCKLREHLKRSLPRYKFYTSHLPCKGLLQMGKTPKLKGRFLTEHARDDKWEFKSGTLNKGHTIE